MTAAPIGAAEPASAAAKAKKPCLGITPAQLSALLPTPEALTVNTATTHGCDLRTAGGGQVGFAVTTGKRAVALSGGTKHFQDNRIVLAVSVAGFATGWKAYSGVDLSYQSVPGADQFTHSVVAVRTKARKGKPIALLYAALYYPQGQVPGTSDQLKAAVIAVGKLIATKV